MELTEWQKRAIRIKEHKKAIARSIVDGFEKDLNSRNGMGFEKLSKDWKEGIRKEWTKMVMRRLVF